MLYSRYNMCSTVELISYISLQLLSYGGELSYTVTFAAVDGSGLSNHEPQVLIRGGHLRKLVIYIDMPAPENSIRTTQRVPLTEVSFHHTPHAACKIHVPDHRGGVMRLFRGCLVEY